MSLQNTLSNERYWSLIHANEGRYAVGTYVWGSDLNIYELNADKGGAVPGDPTVDPVSGDGSTTADWIDDSLSQVEIAEYEKIQIVASNIDALGIVTLNKIPNDDMGVRVVIDGIVGIQNGIDFTSSNGTLTFSDYMKGVLNNPLWTPLPVMDVHYNVLGAGSEIASPYKILSYYTPAIPITIDRTISNPIALGFDVDKCDFLDFDITEVGNGLSTTVRTNVRNVIFGTTRGSYINRKDDQYYTADFANLAAKTAGDMDFHAVNAVTDVLIHEVRGLVIT